MSNHARHQPSSPPSIQRYTVYLEPFYGTNNPILYLHNIIWVISYPHYPWVNFIWSTQWVPPLFHGEKSWLNRSYLFLAKSINFSRFGRPPFLEDVLVPPKKRQVCQRRRRRPPCRWRSSCCGTWGRWERRQRGVAWRGNRGPINKQMKWDGNNNDNVLWW